MKLQSINPHDQSVVGELEMSTQEEVKEAVGRTKAAWESWSDMGITARVEYIKKFKTLLKRDTEKLAKLTSLEMGKPIGQSRDDVTGEVAFLEYYINQGP